MIALGVASAVLFYLYFVFGVFFSKLFRPGSDLVGRLLTGLVVLNSIATSLSLLFPVNTLTLVIIILISFILLFFIRDEIREIFDCLRQDRAVLALSAPFIIYAFLIALGAPQHYDTGLYHLQSIKWIESYPAVPGLANLHTRFGFNSNIFTVYALTSLNGLFGQEIFAVNFTLFSLLVCYLIRKMHSIFQSSGVNNLFLFNLIILIAVTNYSRFISSPAPDYIATNLILYIFAKLLDPEEPSKEKDHGNYLVLLLISVYAITVKLSLVPLVLAFLLIFARFRIPFRKIVLTAGIISIIILPWLARFIILTGWVIYPFSSIDLFNFDWKVPVEIVEHEKLAITGWARSPGERWYEAAQMGFREWFPIWWNDHTRQEHIKLIASFAFPLITLALVLIKKIRLHLVQVIAVFTLIICLLYWLIMAPDFRFGSSYILMALLCPLIYLKFSINISWAPRYKPKYFFNLIMFSLLINFIAGNTGKGFVSGSIHRKLRPERIEIPEGYTFSTHEVNGLKITVPDGEKDQCFDLCIPCTPYPNKNMVLRKNSLKDGFRLIGEK